MNAIEEKIIERCQFYHHELVGAIQEIVKIPSIKTPATFSSPYGEEIKRALDHSLNLASKLGFYTKNIDYHVGFAQYGMQKNYIGIMGHLDVVPAGDGWEVSPFSGAVINGRLVGRGVLDNKGPLYTNLYAMKVVQEVCEENNLQLKHAIRIIFGCDEESGFGDVPYYLEQEQPPIYGYTPDCKYPPVYSERGRLKCRLSCDLKNIRPFFKFITEYFLDADNSGNRLGIAISQLEFGNLEMRGYKMDYEGDQVVFQFSISYPPIITKETIIEKIEEKLYNSAFELKIIQHWLPVFFDKEQSFIKIMSQTYEEITGLDGEPVTTTGGTYAKLVPNIIPFGPSFPGQKGIAHQPNEYWDLYDIYKNLEIYAVTLYRLACM